MSHDKISRRYRNLKYAIETLSEVIKSCKIEKVIEEKYKPQLERLIVDFKRVKKMLEDEKKNQKKQREKWYKKIRSLSIDAILDETISEQMEERIVESLTGIAEGVRTHEDS